MHVVFPSPTGYVALNASKFLAAGEPHIRDNRVFCRHLHCKRCSKAKETATIHTDCFKLYIARTKDRLDRLRQLWTLSLARYPWPESPALLLPSVPSVEVMNRANSSAGKTFDSLIRLPQDIITMIWGYLSENDWLRLSYVLETIDFLEHTNQHKALSVPLHHVHSWHRGKEPVIKTTLPRSSIEMTIDSKGIKSIQRSRCSASESRPPFILYITIGVSYNLSIKFQVSRACVWRSHSHANEVF